MFCSDLGRTKETAHYIFPYKKDITYTNLLREKSGGILEGLTLSTIPKKAKEQGIPYRLYKPDKGESWGDLRLRCEKFLKQVANQYVPTKTSIHEETKCLPKVLAVTHKGFICEFLEMYRGISGDRLAGLEVPKNTSIYAFRIQCTNCQGLCRCKQPKLNIKIIIANDNKHLYN